MRRANRESKTPQLDEYIRKWLKMEHDRFWSREWEKMSSLEQRVIDAWAYIENCEEVTESSKRTSS